VINPHFTLQIQETKNIYLKTLALQIQNAQKTITIKLQRLQLINFNCKNILCQKCDCQNEELHIIIHFKGHTETQTTVRVFFLKLLLLLQSPLTSLK
jgi:hypothetical protein